VVSEFYNVNKIQKGERDEMLTIEEQDVWARENQRLVHHTVNKFNSDGRDMDDLFGRAQLGMAQALKKYDGERGVKLSTFVTRCMENEILRLLRSERTQKRFGETCSLEMQVVGKLQLSDVVPEPEKEFNWWEINDVVNRVLSEIKKRDRDIYTMYVSGKTQSQVGKQFQLAQYTISSIVKNINEQIKQEYWRDCV
jgi:RNA polymerase sporulation-specific sigma factor